VEHLNRRDIVAGLLASSAWTTLGAHGATEAVVTDEAMAALQPYTGIYELPGKHQIGIDRFITDAGERSLLFCDYRTNVVRPIFQISRDEFAMGSSFAVRAPVEKTLQFQKGGSAILGLTIRANDGEQVTARKLETREEDVVFTSGDVRLAGTLTAPPGRGPHPAIILLHGSGPLARHSFGPYRQFFGSLGFVVLAYDKRGTGASTGTRIDSSTGAPKILLPRHFPDDLVGDALAAFEFLQGRNDVDPKQIGFWGSSEGGMVATQVAARQRAVAFAIDSSGFMGPLWQTLLYQAGAILRANGRSQADVEQTMEFTRLWMDVARTGNGYDAFLTRRQEIIDGGKLWMLSYTSRDFTSLEQMRWAWDHILAFSPLPALKNVTCPVLGIFGQADYLTEVDEASRAMHLALSEGGNKDITVRIFPNASHSLMQTPSRIGMAPGVFETLRQWLLLRIH
jgi:pimeloyl-ACP methyl ester carboxylesterase